MIEPYANATAFLQSAIENGAYVAIGPIYRKVEQVAKPEDWLPARWVGTADLFHSAAKELSPAQLRRRYREMCREAGLVPVVLEGASYYIHEREYAFTDSHGVVHINKRSGHYNFHMNLDFTKSQGSDAVRALLLAQVTTRVPDTHNYILAAPRIVSRAFMGKVSHSYNAFLKTSGYEINGSGRYEHFPTKEQHDMVVRDCRAFLMALDTRGILHQLTQPLPKRVKAKKPKLTQAA